MERGAWSVGNRVKAGILECWNGGMLRTEMQDAGEALEGSWNVGMMEGWIFRSKGPQKMATVVIFPINPIFHYSTIPSFSTEEFSMAFTEITV